MEQRAGPFHNFMFQLDIGNLTVYHLAKPFMFRVFCFMEENKTVFNLTMPFLY